MSTASRNDFKIRCDEKIMWNKREITNCAPTVDFNRKSEPWTVAMQFPFNEFFFLYSVNATDYMLFELETLLDMVKIVEKCNHSCVCNSIHPKQSTVIQQKPNYWKEDDSFLTRLSTYRNMQNPL